MNRDTPFDPNPKLHRSSKRKTAARNLFAALSTLALALATGLAAGGCFSLKEPACAFSCQQPPHRCPESYACGTDGLCHRNGATATCGLTPPDGGAALNDVRPEAGDSQGEDASGTDDATDGDGTDGETTTD